MHEEIIEVYGDKDELNKMNYNAQPRNRLLKEYKLVGFRNFIDYS